MFEILLSPNTIKHLLCQSYINVSFLFCRNVFMWLIGETGALRPPDGARTLIYNNRRTVKSLVTKQEFLSRACYVIYKQ